jgi:uncharacterized protein
MGKVEDLDKARRARSNQPKKSGPATRRRCPICRKPAVQKHRPFCSALCAEVDLGRWVGGDYRIPGVAANTLNSEDEGSDSEG